MTASGPSPSPDRERIDGLFELAFRRHQAGQLREAEELYRAILAADPRQLDAQYYCGMIALQSGRPDDAVALMSEVLAANDTIAIYHAGIAEAYRALGQRGPAMTHLRKATALAPNDWAAHNQLADLLRDDGALQDAASHYQQAVRLKPDLASAQHNLAAVLLDQGRANDALDAVTRALALRDQTDTRALFVACVRGADRLPNAPEFRRLITRALREAWTRPVALTGPAIALIKSHPAVATAVRAAMEAWPQRLAPGACGPAVSVLATDELTRAVLDTALVNDPEFERLLTSVRTVLLDAAAHATSDLSREMMALAVSLARQCFINEYVFDVADAETQALAWLRTSVRTALAGRTPVFEIHLIALACYAPLSALERDEALLGRSWRKFLDALITEQVREPKAESALRAAMPRLTTIADPVSVEVRAQYEDNPYPRWAVVSPTAPEKSIAAHLRGLFPQAPLRETTEPAAPDILVAGCGTGQQPIGTAQRFPAARVLAIDLSLASLAYAKRKSDAAGVRIDYAQADILELPADRSFDMIESSGVLHHLAEPLRGWAKLTSLLKPGGFMRIGLYSETGRQNVVALRELLTARGYGASADDIRRCRQEVISANDPRFLTIVHSPDFCSVSACRDLLFHVQEHRLTLPQIAKFLAENGLTLLGFELDGGTLRRYRAAFPDDATMTDLASWDRFETANPDTFGGMYQFWLQKAG
jgi:SAM-dependent methyltransferase/Flp pilus assembly protein TadD